MSTGVAGGLRGVAMPQDLALGPLTRLEVRWRVQTPGTRLRSVTPFTDGAVAGAWRGGNGRVGPTRRGSCGGLGPDPVPECSHGLTYHNQVGRSIGQSPSGESQRGRSAGQLVQG